MDPASAIGVASAALSIVNLIAKSVSSLSDLQSRFNAADLRVSLLIGQLSTVKAALNQIAKLLEGTHGALLDSELISDFSSSIGCVQAVVVVLDDKISLVQRNSANELTIQGKAHFMWDEKTMDDYLNLLNNQIHALGLLLTALQCRTSLEQSNLLQSRESRDVFDRVKDDTSSLLWLRDAESVQTYRSTEIQDLRTVNTTFTFDPEVFNSKVYQTATRSNMIRALFPNRRKVPYDGSSLASASQYSASITRNPISQSDNTITVDRLPKSTGIIVMMTEFGIKYSEGMSAPQSSRPSTHDHSSTLETIKDSVSGAQSPAKYSLPSITHDYFTIHTRETLRPVPAGSVFKYKPPKDTDRPLKWSSIAPEKPAPPRKKGDLSAYRQLVSLQRSRRGQVTHHPEPADCPVDRPQGLGIKVLVLGISGSGKTTLQKSMKIAFEDEDEEWRLSYKSDVYMILESEDEDVSLGRSTNRLLTSGRSISSASQIAEINCIPTIQEVLWAQNRSVGLYESQYVIDGTLCRFFDVGGTRSERRKWSFEISDVNSVIFTLDVSCYDQVLIEDNSANRMTEQLAVWSSLVQLEKLAATNFIVMFTKTDKVTPSKLEASPFNSLFPDYAGKADSLEDILQYLARLLETSSDEWTTRSLIFCNAGSIRDSPTTMAEVAVSALSEVGCFQRHDQDGGTALGTDTRTVRGKTITHVTGVLNSRNTVFWTGSVGDYTYQYPGRNPAAWTRARGGVARAAGATEYHGENTDDHGEDEISLRYGSPEVNELSRNFHGAMRPIEEEYEEDLKSHANGSGMCETSNEAGGSAFGEGRLLWRPSQGQSQTLMWT